MAAEEFDIQKRYEKKKEEERKKEKGIVEDKKKVVQIIKFQLSPGAARPGPPIGPVLGQHQINTNDFCKEFNKLTEKMDPKLVLSVLVFKKADRSFDIKLKGPTTNFYKGKFMKESAATAGGRFKSGDLLFSVISPKLFDYPAGGGPVSGPKLSGQRIFKGAKTILGTLRSSKVRVS